MAAETFELLLSNRLLARWVETARPSCGRWFARSLATSFRIVPALPAAGPAGGGEHLERGGELGVPETPAEELDLFEAAWGDDLLNKPSSGCCPNITPPARGTTSACFTGAFAKT